jgi:hypothetical protein
MAQAMSPYPYQFTGDEHSGVGRGDLVTRETACKAGDAPTISSNMDALSICSSSKEFRSKVSNPSDRSTDRSQRLFVVRITSAHPYVAIVSAP